MFDVTLVGGADLMVHLDEMPSSVQALLKTKIAALAIILQQHVVNDKLHGQILNQRTGALAQSIQEEAPIVDETSVFGRVFASSDVKYAAIHEYGFDGEETVKQHVRTMVFGKAVAPFSVGPFARYMNMPERSYMRTALADRSAEIVSELEAAVIEGIKQALGHA
jgi:phage gpG-like protein